MIRTYSKIAELLKFSATAEDATMIELLNFITDWIT